MRFDIFGKKNNKEYIPLGYIDTRNIEEAILKSINIFPSYKTKVKPSKNRIMSILKK